MAFVREAIWAAFDKLEEKKALKTLKKALLETDSQCTVETLRNLLGEALVALQSKVAKKVDKSFRQDGDESLGAAAKSLLSGIGAATLKALVEKVCVKVHKSCDPLLHKVALALSVHRMRTASRSMEMNPLHKPDVEQGGQRTAVPLKRGELWNRMLSGIKAALKNAIAVKFDSKTEGITAMLLNKKLPGDVSLGALHKCAEEFKIACEGNCAWLSTASP